MKTLIALSALTLALFNFGCATHTTSSDCHGATTRSWSAWNNVMPGADKKVHVVGKVHVNSGGWKADLSKRVPQGINPEILMLDLNVTPPTGIVTMPILDLDVTYAESSGGAKFTRAQVFCGDKLVADLPVKDVQ